MAVLAVAAANLIRWSNYARPHGSRGALRNRFQLEGCLAFRGKLLVDLGDHRFKAADIGVAAQFGPYTARMYGGGADTAFTVPVIEGNGKEDVGGLRAAIRDEGFILRALKVWILQVNVGITMACGGEVDQPSSGADERSNPVDEDEVAQMVGAELHLEAVLRVGKRCGHHPRIGDDYIEGFTLLE